MFFLPTTLGSPDKEDMFEEDTTCFAQGCQAMEHMHKLLLQRSENSWLKAKVWCDDVMQNRGHENCVILLQQWYQYIQRYVIRLISLYLRYYIRNTKLHKCACV